MVVAAAAIPWLAAALGGLFSGLVSWFAKRLTKKIAAISAFTVGVFALSALYFSAMYGLYSLFDYVSPPLLADALSLVMPSNTAGCVTAVATARTARWVYVWNYRFIETTALV